MASLTISGRAALAKAVLDKQASLFLAWGSGSAGWDVTPVAADANTTSLTAEIGRARCSVASFVVPDAGGAVVTPSGRYTVSATPTVYLYLKFDFNNEFPSGLSIREVGLFSDVTLDPAILPGQYYILPGDVVEAGYLLATERFTVFTTVAEVNQVFQFVLPF